VCFEYFELICQTPSHEGSPQTRRDPAPQHHPALTVNVEIDPLVEVVRRHVKLSAQATRSVALHTPASDHFFFTGEAARATSPAPARRSGLRRNAWR